MFSGSGSEALIKGILRDLGNPADLSSQNGKCKDLFRKSSDMH
jgi:hypothetical protein